MSGSEHASDDEWIAAVRLAGALAEAGVVELVVTEPGAGVDGGSGVGAGRVLSAREADLPSSLRGARAGTVLATRDGATRITRSGCGWSVESTDATLVRRARGE